jgi:hypothetical protein
MNPCNRCRTTTPDRGNPSRRGSRWWHRGGEIAGWIIPGAILIFLPKCPVCLAMDVALISGAGISIASASKLRISLLVLCLAALLGLALKHLCRLVAQNKKRSTAQTQKDSV